MEILEKARELGDLLRKDPRCLRLQAAKAGNDVDGGLQRLIEEFGEKRRALARAMGEKPADASKVETCRQEVRRMYSRVMDHPGMKEYAAAKRDVDELIEHIDGIVQAGVTGGPEPEPPEEGGFPGCAGRCEGCAGCR